MFNGDRRSCTLCGSDAFRKLFSASDLRTASPGHHDVVACNRCGFTLLNPPPGEESLAEAYPDWLWQDELARGRVMPSGVTRTLEILGRHTSGPGTLLDVGCGPGSLLAAAASRGWKASGVESSLAQVAHCRASGRDAKHITDFSAMPDDGRQYDAVIFDHVLEHVPSPVAYLDKAFQLTKPGGCVLIGVPNFASLSARLFGRYWMHLDAPRHLYHFTRHTLARCVAKAHGRIIRIYTGDGEDNAAGARESLRRWVMHGMLRRPAAALRAPSDAGPPNTSVVRSLFHLYGAAANRIGNFVGMPDTIIAIAQRREW